MRILSLVSAFLFSVLFLLNVRTCAQTPKPPNILDGEEIFCVLVAEQIEVDYHRSSNVLDITLFNADHSTTDVYYGPASSAVFSPIFTTFTAPGVIVVVDMQTGNVTYNYTCYIRRSQ